MRRVTILTYELRGLAPVGGMGTATTHLALALARQGHAVDILLGWQDAGALDPDWADLYAHAGIAVRSVPSGGESVDTWHFDAMRRIELALRENPPDVVVAHDFYAPAYSALRLREAGLAFERTLFVVFCHGTKGYIMDTARQVAVKDLRTALAIRMLERSAVELADVVVSPSAYLIDWMRTEGWTLPEQTHVIPYFTRSGALGETPLQASTARPQRLAFFGRLDEKKGVVVFAEGLNALEPELLDGIELEFVGKPTASWPRDRIEGLLAPRTRSALGAVGFETALDQQKALERLRRPGTLAVMPSLLDNSPNTVYECLEHGIPFVASAVGGVPELIAPADRARVLFDPTAAGVEGALRYVLESAAPHRPAVPGFDAARSAQRWAELLARQPPASPTVDPPNVDLIVARGDSIGFAQGDAPFVLVLDGADEPDPALVPTLARAQAHTGADVVTCGLRLPDGLRFFSGEPGGLGVLANDYGTVGLFRRSLLADISLTYSSDRDPNWPLLARLAAAGRRIVSIPMPLVTQPRQPGTVETHPEDALLVVQALEHSLPAAASSLARLTAGLAATTSARTGEQGSATSRRHPRARSFARRVLSARPRSPR